MYPPPSPPIPSSSHNWPSLTATPAKTGLFAVVAVRGLVTFSTWVYTIGLNPFSQVGQ